MPGSALSRRRFLGVGLGWVVGGGAAAGGRAADTGGALDWLELGRKVLEDRVDPAVLEALRAGDPASVDAVLNGVMSALGGENVGELAGWGEAAELALPWLERLPRTRAYAPWLRSRLDYFRVAERLVPKGEAPKAGVVSPNPTPEKERQAWQQQVARQPVPKGASTWVPRLKPVFRSAGAPSELVWLAEVESAFDPGARSPAGAAGMYQLMPGTAEGLGLKLRPQDERLVPEKNARAAAGYLKSLRARFGDWRLVMAAYNAGPGRVSDLLKRRRATTFDAIAPSLPAETQMYVPKFEAVLRRREGIGWSGLVVPGAGRK